MILQKNNVFTIEDCTHGFGGNFKGKPNGSFCDAAFYSTQWNKPFSTGIGGFALVKDEILKKRLININQYLITSSLKDQLSLSILYFVKEKILTDSLYWLMIKFYRFLSKYNFVQGSSSGCEICSTNMSHNYFKAISNVQIKKGIKILITSKS